MSLVEVVIDSVRVSLMSQHRVVILKDANRERYLTIWIGTFEADAITIGLQEQAHPRPLTHDLINSAITAMGGEIKSVEISELKEDVYHARIVINQNGKEVGVDSRSSDALALAVRARCPIFVDELVMDRASNTPDREIRPDQVEDKPATVADDVPDDQLSVFKDFVESLDLDDLDDSEPDKR